MRPEIPKKVDGKTIPVVLIELDDQDIFKFITGGMHGLKAFAQGKIKIAGDLLLATELEEVFIKTGGVEKTKQFMAKAVQTIAAQKKRHGKNSAKL